MPLPSPVILKCELSTAIREALAKNGYPHYEISNFAQPGHEAEHNSAYWKHVPYVGLGPGAHSFMEQVSHDGALLKVRQWNAESLEKYVDAGRSGDFHRLQESEVLDEEQLLLEKVMLGLRTSSGIEEQLLRGFCGEETVDTALASGSLESCGAGFLRIPESGFFVSDNIVLDLVGRSNN